MSTPPLIEAIAAGGAGRYVCPRCQGGTDREESLSIRFDEAAGIHWRCFRSSCGYTGGPRGVRTVFSGPRKEPRHYTRPVTSLNAEQEDILDTRFGLPASIVDGYNETDDRFILGVYGPVGYNRRGSIAYSLSGATPKSLTYNEKPDEPFVHYAGAGSLVIVEDWFSAEKVAAAGARGVAIMGTHINQDIVTELVENAAGPTYVALDRDAFTKTLLYLSRYREQFPRGLFAWSLKVDLKYETTTRIKEALNGATNFISDAKRKERV